MKTIAVDIGNTSTKLAWLNCDPTLLSNDCSDRWANRVSFQGTPSDACQLPNRPARWLVTSVNCEAEAVLRQWVNQHRPEDRFELVQREEIQLGINVDFPKKVGVDRLVAALAAGRLAADSHPVLVIDSGTATTADFVTAANANGSRQFEGGAIFPGVGTLFHSLSSSTASLPDLTRLVTEAIENGIWETKIGKSTEQAILIGVLHMHLATITDFITEYSQLHPSIEIFATGGGCELIKSLLPKSISYVPDLVLRGTLSLGASDHSGEIGS